MAIRLEEKDFINLYSLTPEQNAAYINLFIAGLGSIPSGVIGLFFLRNINAINLIIEKLREKNDRLKFIVYDLDYVIESLKDCEIKNIELMSIKEKRLEELGKFDHIIMNPPYSGSLHLKILREAMAHSDDIVNLSPIRWLQDPLAEYKKNSDWKEFENIRHHISSLDVISANDGGKFFSIELKVDLGIYHMTKDIKENDNIFRNSIVDKVISNGSYGIPYSENSKKEKKYGCLLTLITGGHDGFNTTFSDCSLLKNEKTYGKWFVDGKSEMNGLTLTECKALNKRSVNGDVTKWPFAWFDTEEEVKNFYDFTWTKFFKYCLKKTTVDVHVHPQFLPYLGDYTHPWTDTMLYKYFGLTDDEIKTIENEIK